MKFKESAPANDDKAILVIDIIRETGAIKNDHGTLSDKKIDIFQQTKENIENQYKTAYENYKNNRLEEALVTLEHLSRFSGSNDVYSKAVNLRGHIYYLLNRWNEAMACWKEAYELSPENGNIKNNLDTLIKKMGKGN